MKSNSVKYRTKTVILILIRNLTTSVYILSFKLPTSRITIMIDTALTSRNKPIIIPLLPSLL